MTEPSHSPQDSRDRGAEVDDRRRNRREETHVGIRVKVETESFGGRTQNVSPGGVFFFSPDHVRVSVELEEGGEVVTRHGRLVRVERMNEDTAGFAIEFDRA